MNVFVPTAWQFQVCFQTEWTYHGNKNTVLLSQWTGPHFWWNWRPAQYLVSESECLFILPLNCELMCCLTIFIVTCVFIYLLCKDGSVLQTVVTGLGSVVCTTWIPNVGAAVCSGRSKVRMTL